MNELKNKEELLNGDIILELYSPTCIPCKKQAKILEGLEGSNALPNVTFFKCDSTTELGSELCEQYNLMSAPSTLCFRDGKVIETYTRLTMHTAFKSVFEREFNYEG